MRKGVVIGVTSILLVVSIIGFVVSLALNAFVFDKYDAYGEVPIPGSGTVTLPAGDVTVSFHTQIIGSTSGGGLPVPSNLEFVIVPPEGVTDPSVSDTVGGTTTVNNDARRQLWTVHVAKAGDYAIRTKGSVTAFISPRLAFGHDSSYGFLPWVFGGLGAASLLALLATIFFWRTSRRPSALGVGTTFSVGPPLPPPAADPHVPTDQGIRLEQLKTLASLHESGALTDEEFETEKRRILGQ
ncbi:MAG: hypothetical protein QOH60_4488 [Mycobacterium sp.]|jgi:hypothetical protein|nr:hypothetical protein [Mycobacterium sp.]